MKFLSRLFPSLNKHEGEFLVKISAIIGLKPIQSELYKLALRHSSATKFSKHNTPLNNQRLEFLGDAILGAIIAQYLYNKYPDANEGFLTAMRSKLVSRKNLNKIAEEIGLNALVISKLDKRKPAKSVGGDALEALIGAIYIDLGFTKCKTFVNTKIINKNITLDALETHVISYKGVFIEWAQKEKIDYAFSLKEQWGKQHSMMFKMQLTINGTKQFEGVGSSKKRAEEDAAKKAYTELAEKNT